MRVPDGEGSLGKAPTASATNDMLLRARLGHEVLDNDFLRIILYNKLPF